jgi:hypothetical protein
MIDVDNAVGLGNIFHFKWLFSFNQRHLEPLRKVFVNIHVCNDKVTHFSIFHYNIDQDLNILDPVLKVCTPIISVVSQIENTIYVLKIHVEKLSRFSGVYRFKGLNRQGTQLYVATDYIGI